MPYWTSISDQLYRRYTSTTVPPRKTSPVIELRVDGSVCFFSFYRRKGMKVQSTVTILKKLF